MTYETIIRIYYRSMFDFIYRPLLSLYVSYIHEVFSNLRMHHQIIQHNKSCSNKRTGNQVQEEEYGCPFVARFNNSHFLFNLILFY